MFFFAALQLLSITFSLSIPKPNSWFLLKDIILSVGFLTNNYISRLKVIWRWKFLIVVIRLNNDIPLSLTIQLCLHIPHTIRFYFSRLCNISFVNSYILFLIAIGGRWCNHFVIYENLMGPKVKYNVIVIKKIQSKLQKTIHITPSLILPANILRFIVLSPISIGTFCTMFAFIIEFPTPLTVTDYSNSSVTCSTIFLLRIETWAPLSTTAILFLASVLIRTNIVLLSTVTLHFFFFNINS